MAKRKTAIDRAIDLIDKDIAVVEGQLEVLRATRSRLEGQREPEAATNAAKRGHPEGGRGI